MPILFTLAISLLIFGGLCFPFSRLFWPEIIEGQVSKQSFVVHLIESWMRGDTLGGFPIRFFVEPSHAGPIPWAEEVPLYHWIATAVAQLTGMNAVHSARVTSFAFALLLVISIRGLARILFPAPPPSLSEPVPSASKTAMIAAGLAAPLLIWTPAFQIYSSSAIPDLAMMSMIAFAYWLRLKQFESGVWSEGPGAAFARPHFSAYLALAIACLLKYFAFFALLALFIFDCILAQSSTARWRARLRAFGYAVLAGLPTLVYLYYFISHHVPNPITEYMSANGYGHLAGPFLLRGQFYARAVTWILVKNPTWVLSIAAILGAGLAIRSRFRAERALSDRHRPGWLLLRLHTASYVAFALLFASSFYVHDYYAIPFLLPILFYACYAFSWMLNRGPRTRIAGATAIALALILGTVLSQDATFRLTNYLSAAENVRGALPDAGDRKPDQMAIFVSDFSLPVLPILSGKAGWVFDVFDLEAQRGALIERLHSPAFRGLVFYMREPGANEWLQKWRALDPFLGRMKIVTDETWPSEGRKGAATRLVVLHP